MNPGRSKQISIWLLSALFLFWSLVSPAEWMTPGEREQLWREAHAQLLAHPRLAYHNGANLPDYPGFIVTNESAFWTMKPPPAGDAKMQVGFATIVNFNILAARRGTSLVSADQSEEAVVAMMSYWRPLFLASETPELLIAHIAGFVPKDGDTVDSLFARIQRGEKGTEAGRQALDAKLEALVKAKKITAFDRKFADAITRDQIPNPRAGVVPQVEKQLPSGLWVIEKGEKPVFSFRKAVGGSDIAASLAHVYGARPATPEEAAARRLLSFLERGGFGHVRGVLEKNDHYAVGSITDGGLWRGIAAVSKKRGEPMTDLYVSNIPGVSRLNGVHLGTLIDMMKEDVPGTRLATYEAAAKSPYSFFTKVEEREGSGEYRVVETFGTLPTYGPSVDMGCANWLEAIFRLR